MINVLYVNFDASHKEDFAYDIPGGHPFWLLLLVHTTAVFKVDGVEKEYPPNTMILYKPHQSAYYRAAGETYSNDWIRFETDDPLITESPVPTGEPFAIKENIFIHMLFQLMTSEYPKESLMREDTLEKLLLVLFNKLTDVFSVTSSEAVCNNIHDLHRLIYKQPSSDWSVDMMAEKLNLSTSHLEKIYKKEYGKSCMEEVILSRVQMAKKYLKDEGFSTNEIIQMCGYRSSGHFYRQFKKITGMTPGEYRSGSKDGKD